MHIVGVSSLAAGHLTLIPELKTALEAERRGDILIVVGGVIRLRITPRCTRLEQRPSSGRARTSPPPLPA